MIDYHAIAQASKASQDKVELEELLRIVGEIKPEIVLEIGVHRGYSMQTWRQAFRRVDPRLTIIGVDPDFKSFDDSLFNTDLYDHKRNVLIEKYSHDALTDVNELIANSSIDFLFLDGNHMYDSVKKDFELYSPLVRKGGIVAFHDARITDNDTVEVYKFWNEIKHQYKHKEIFSSTGTGTGVIWL